MRRRHRTRERHNARRVRWLSRWLRLDAGQREPFQLALEKALEPPGMHRFRNQLSDALLAAHVDTEALAALREEAVAALDARLQFMREAAETLTAEQRLKLARHVTPQAPAS